MASKVRVAVRVRPFREEEAIKGTPSCVLMKGQSTLLRKEGENDRQFTYDYSHWSHDGFVQDPGTKMFKKASLESSYADQWQIYQDIGSPILNNAVHGFNACIFAYGQTGSGKSYTMVGTPENMGLIPLFCQELFGFIDENLDPSQLMTLEMNMFEIYNERVFDLLQDGRDREVDVMETIAGFYFDGLSNQKVDTYEQLAEVMKAGNRNRTIAATRMNDTSSRAHTIYRLIFTQGSVDRNTGEEFDSIVSEINLVDLAGSERVGQTGATGERFDEGTKINWSLSNLRNVITALTSKHSHIPYRDSKLTFILKNALGGNSKTAMIANISPAVQMYSQTLSTLKYAQQVKFIENKAIVNLEPVDPELARLRQELAELRELIGEKDLTVQSLILELQDLKGRNTVRDVLSEEQQKMSESNVRKSKSSVKSSCACCIA